MLRNVPNNYSREMMLALLDHNGFQLQYDFMYLPIDFSTEACLGYAFVNLISEEIAMRFWNIFDGYTRWIIPSRKCGKVDWSDPHQGLASNIERYRNSPVMHEEVPMTFKPMVFDNGKEVLFPGPTQKLRMPRIRGMKRWVGAKVGLAGPETPTQAEGAQDITQKKRSRHKSRLCSAAVSGEASE